MPLYVADYLADTQSLTTEQHGAYLLMLMHYWRSGEAIPDDMVTLRMVTKLSTHKLKKFVPTLEKIFQHKDGKYFHSRVESELAKAKEISEVRAKAGRKGGEANAKQMPPKSYTEEPSNEGSRERSKKRAPAKGCRFSLSLVTERWAEVAQELRPDLNANDVMQDFADYWTAKTGKDATKADWLATWRRWLRNEKREERKGTVSEIGRNADEWAARIRAQAGGRRPC